MSETKRPDIDAIEARATAATPGPWRAQKHNMHWSTICADVFNIKSLVLAEVQNHTHPDERQIAISDANAVFVANAREDVPALLAYARELEAERGVWQAREREGVEIFEALLESPLGWEGSGWRCRYCGKPGSPQAGVKHAPDCDWLRARAWLEG